MPTFRFPLAMALSAVLSLLPLPAAGAPPQPIAILMQANLAHLDEANALPGLSIFEGERLQTELGGRIALRLGRASLAIAGNSEAALIRITGGVHIDLAAGTIRFAANEAQAFEVHAEGALVRSQPGQAADAAISILTPKVLQIDARHGSLDFSYRQEFRNLPKGQIYRIYLDSPDKPESEASVSSQVGSLATKVTFYIVGAGAAGSVGWLTYDAVHSGNAPISPAKP